MKIVVCVKYVPDAPADRTFRESDNTVDRDDVDGLLSELDEYAVEQALQIVEEAGEGEVTVLTVGPEAPPTPSEGPADGRRQGRPRRGRRDPRLRRRRPPRWCSPRRSRRHRRARPRPHRHGVDRRHHGRRARRCSPSGSACPQVTFASEVTVDGGTVKVRRDGDTATEQIEATLPAVVSRHRPVDEPRYPSFKGIMAAKKKPVETWAWPTSASTPRGRPRGRLDRGRRVRRSARRAPRARSSRTRATAAPARRVPRRPEVHLSPADD